MSKRRIFDIDFPSEETPETPAAEPTTRRGPMASAISENADALRERQVAEQVIRAENDALAQEHVRMKEQGLIVDLVPIECIEIGKLKRDRREGRDADLDELKASIRAIGLSNPIRVEQTETGYQLIQGFRRLSAYRELFDETGDEAFAKIPAGLVARGEALETLYRRMVDENLVRRDISFAEMAELARKYAADPATPAPDVEAAVAALYGSAGRQKRAYIRNFASLLDRIGSYLNFPEAIPRSLGLSLLKQVERTPGTVARIQANLRAAPDRNAEQELEVLREALSNAPQPPKKKVARAGGAKTTFRVPHADGTVKCTAADGRLEVVAARDFSAQDRHKLEAAVAAFFAVLDEN
ncbi:ParB/RepB/Spo0J family partition protein (plasmid) [Falsihalocynthiibacter sp. SS001]|uniref:ParB/RepB/Spo0J family partition protein n=1 Tax=Falsihalocynthiibacter sp. SS001 TaxID=3349698 RepID=UPI0036D2B207